MYFKIPKFFPRSFVLRNTSVNIQTDYGLDACGSILGRGKNFYFLHHNQTGSKASQISYPLDPKGSFPMVRRPKREIYHQGLDAPYTPSGHGG